MVARKTTPKTFGDWAYQAIAKSSDQVFRYEGAVLEDKDPEDLHQMRVNLRRLRSVFAGFNAALDCAITERKIAKCGRFLGRLRDCDVMLETLTQLADGDLPKSEKQSLGDLIAVLKQERQQQFKATKAFLLSGKYQTLKSQLQGWLEKPKYQAIAAVDIRLILPDLLLPQLATLLMHPGWRVGISLKKATTAQLNKLFAQHSKYLHNLRKVAKRSRYNRELFLSFYGKAYKRDLKQIKQVQSIIGEFQDLDVLTCFLQQHFEQPLSKKLPTISKQLNCKRRSLWQEWQLLQKKFLDPDYRRALHQTLIG
ncbi:CHAD domain containing protein [[Leptolyngbya] sp. PCC 7376]|uniref:CHAD domain-containing protein n=1 Tax=[Leptolyngbya] sp. PCC 7376 TaxID=111781 RepID=UPI00029EE812|nr:CHAD domain-containing protein [[Leptolyngbya] sp. PCC 7376]AFY36711.1 CHAD domain containing protein [[Leptolyngbya] sp. PCC 7376]